MPLGCVFGAMLTVLLGGSENVPNISRIREGWEDGVGLFARLTVVLVPDGSGIDHQLRDGIRSERLRMWRDLFEVICFAGDWIFFLRGQKSGSKVCLFVAVGEVVVN
eukprot:scaffold4438_cov56-Cyclotella_meneghiniana.AAC.8